MCVLSIVVCPSFGNCVVCSSSIYGFWWSLWYLQTLLTDFVKRRVGYKPRVVHWVLKDSYLPINILLSVIDPDFQNKDLIRTYIHTNVLPPVDTSFLPVITDHIYRGSSCSQVYFYFGFIFRVVYLWFWIVILSFSTNSCILLCHPVTWYILASVDAFKPADVYCWNTII